MLDGRVARNSDWVARVEWGDRRVRSLARVPRLDRRDARATNGLAAGAEIEGAEYSFGKKPSDPCFSSRLAVDFRAIAVIGDFYGK